MKFVLILLILTGIVTNAQREMKINLTTNLKTTLPILENEDDIIVCYSIEGSGIKITNGTYYLNPEQKFYKLSEYISNPELYNSKQYSGNDIAIYTSEGNKQESNERAFLFYKTTNGEIDLSIIGLNDNVALPGKVFYWLGKQTEKRSLEFLISAFESAEDNDYKENLISAIGVHASLDETLGYLISAYQNFDKGIKENILFWIGKQDKQKSLDFLLNEINNAGDLDIREAAIVGLAQMNKDKAVDELLSIAKYNSDSNLREEAVMWLGYKAIKKMKSELMDFIKKDPDIRIKKTALYTLMNREWEGKEDYLIEIAETHDNFELRKTAIYLMGDYGNTKAVDWLAEKAVGK